MTYIILLSMRLAGHDGMPPAPYGGDLRPCPKVPAAGILMVTSAALAVRAWLTPGLAGRVTARTGAASNRVKGGT